VFSSERILKHLMVILIICAVESFRETPEGPSNLEKRNKKTLKYAR
jgi:hypothetical protein